MIGEYVGRIYDEVKRRPLFVVDALEGFERPVGELEEGAGRTAPASARRGLTARRAGGPRSPPVAILAGGLGTRLGGAAAGLPKGMVPVAGRPFLEHVLERLARGGVDAGRHLPRSPRRGHRGAASATGRRFGLSIAYSDEGPEPIGTAGALRRALPLLGERFLVMYGDTYLRVDYAEVAARPRALRARRR